MSAASEACENHVRGMLETMKFRVEKLPENPMGVAEPPRMADFKATDELHTYLVEVTEAKDKRYLDLMSPIVGGQITAPVPGTTLMRDLNKPYDGLVDKIADKDDQLSRTPIQADFKVLWMVAHQGWALEDAHAEADQIERYLYGMIDLSGFDHDPTSAADVEASRRTLRCLFFHDYGFKRHPDLDAVGFVSDCELRLWPNPKSPRAEVFKRSRLFQEIAKVGEIFDSGNWSGTPGETGIFVSFGDDVSACQDQLEKWRLIRDKYGWWTRGIMGSDVTSVQRPPPTLVQTPPPFDPDQVLHRAQVTFSFAPAPRSDS